MKPFIVAFAAACAIAGSAMAAETTRSADHDDNSTAKRKSASATPAPKRKSAATSTAAATPRAGEKKNRSASATKKSENEASDAAKGGGSSAKTSGKIDPAAPPPEKVPSAANASITSSDLVEFSAQPERIKRLIEAALALTRENLTYLYGSADPANGGMDCSGFIYYILRAQGFADVPRAANEQYIWVRKADEFDAVLSKKKQSFELDALQPGDLLFWTGTYTIERDPPVTHTMIYLGTERDTKQRVMVGSSDGRTYRGKAR
ncbi:MAG TPA: NlpC/P60 family protein, partial [Chthoniobacteraceae bacterium]|nr:NlpC/P60 family protein [Chthoniobacteraceae bacterium]